MDLPSTKRLTTDQYEELAWRAYDRDDYDEAEWIEKHEEFMNRNVVVKYGKRVPIGMTGYVFWMKRENDYSQNYSNIICGIKTHAGAKHYIDANNIELVK